MWYHRVVSNKNNKPRPSLVASEALNTDDRTALCFPNVGRLGGAALA